MVSGQSKAGKTILASVYALDLELFPGLDAILPADLRGENDLALAGDDNLHRYVRYRLTVAVSRAGEARMAAGPRDLTPVFFRLLGIEPA